MTRPAAARLLQAGLSHSRLLDRLRLLSLLPRAIFMHAGSITLLRWPERRHVDAVSFGIADVDLDRTAVARTVVELGAQRLKLGPRRLDLFLRHLHPEVPGLRALGIEALVQEYQAEVVVPEVGHAVLFGLPQDV